MSVFYFFYLALSEDNPNCVWELPEACVFRRSKILPDFGPLEENSLWNKKIQTQCFCQWNFRFRIVMPVAGMNQSLTGKYSQMQVTNCGGRPDVFWANTAPFPPLCSKGCLRRLCWFRWGEEEFCLPEVCACTPSYSNSLFLFILVPFWHTQSLLALCVHV